MHDPRGTIVNVIEAKVHEYRCQEKEDVDNAVKRFYPKLSKERLKQLAGRSEQVELQGGFKTFLIPVECGFYNRKEADNA